MTDTMPWENMLRGVRRSLDLENQEKMRLWRALREICNRYEEDLTHTTPRASSLYRIAVDALQEGEPRDGGVDGEEVHPWAT